MGYSTLKAALDAVVKTNGRQQITGSNLNGVMTTLLRGVDVLDRANPADTSGMNKVVLDKSKTFAEQVTSTNTIYEIRDEYNLGGNSITIPSGSVLKFNGGKIKNGTLVDALIVGDRETILDNINFTGLKNGMVFPEWFGAVADGVTECSTAFAKCMSLGKSVILSAGTYLVTNQITCSAYASIFGENKIRSIIMTNGFILSVGSVVKNVTFKSISKTTPFLLKITTNNLPQYEYMTGIVVENVILNGAAFSEYDTGVTGMVIETETNSNVVGFYDLNVHDVEFAGKMLYGMYFTAKSENAWMTFCNFHDIFINGAKYPIEFESVAQNYYNFQNLVFERVVAQYNFDSTQTPSVQWTQSFVRLSHCSRVSFDACGCVDIPSGIHPYYFKDSFNGIAVTNAIEGSLSNLFANESGTDYQRLISQHLLNIPSVLSSNEPFLIPAYPSNNTARDTTTPPTKSLIMAKSILSERFVGLLMTNNLQMLGERREMLLGMVDGHIVHSGQTAANGTFSLKAVYSTGYVPVHETTFPTGWQRGTFLYWVGLRHLLCYDNYTGQWTDALNTRISTNITKRRGSTADRTAMTMNSYNDGFLFYDTDLKKYVLWNGTAWVNVDGTALV